MLNDYIRGRDNNLDILRFLIATWVVYVHSFPLSGTDYMSERLRVMTFFIISGFFITLSLMRNSNLFNFFKSRIIRLYPGLIFIVIFTIFLLGPLVSSMNVTDYFLHPETYRYFKVLFIKGLEGHSLPGAFENNIYPNTVNGSLWTIYYEVIFYIGIAGLSLLGLLTKRIMLLLFMLSFILFFIPITSGKLLIELFIFFSIGSVFYLYRNRIPINIGLALIALVSLLICWKLEFFVHGYALFGSYLVIFLIFYKKINIPFSTQLGNYSYSLFLFGFPIQQTVTHFYGGSMNPLTNFLISFPIALVFSMISWNFIEKHFIKYKNKPLNKKTKTIKSMKAANQ
ncbi:acyltransferase [Bacillus sp. B15-48]|uniref:acyltransferase family protein n=1 Tax=Bacillus sp. B15-48 TaxID=1548601 RepID=UPI00193ED7F8|nr:acyltransferase [Bacillus sp. B15-48]MBM4764484.1 acyltransferase family protein [Bacillus sp. B15-48]